MSLIMANYLYIIYNVRYNKIYYSEKNEKKIKVNLAIRQIFLPSKIT